jgi:CelD/BcsL family acetyltransferase involved in cellulose biosynthesis
MTATALDWEELNLSSDGEEWDLFQSRAFGATPFHRAAWLRAAERASHFRLRAIVVREGGGWVATVPLYESRRGPVRLTWSPPPNLGLPFLGPTMFVPSASRASHREGLWRQLVSLLLERVDRDWAPHVTRLILGPDFQDIRPFIWSGFQSVPKYRYVIDLGPPPTTLLGSFQQEARKWIRRAEGRIVFREGGIAEALSIVEGTARRYREQGRMYGVTPPFMNDLFDSVTAGSLRSFVVEREGTFVTGLIGVVEEGIFRVWQGGHRPQGDEPGASEWLMWSAMLWARERGRTTFEILGANTPQLVRFKLKFNPELRLHFMVERATRFARLAMRSRARHSQKSAEAARWATMDE